MPNFLIQPKPELVETLDRHTDFVKEYLRHRYIPEDQNPEEQHAKIIAELGVEEIERREREWRRLHPGYILAYSSTVWRLENLSQISDEEFRKVCASIKILHLARLATSYKIEGERDNYQTKMHALFGDPPEFSVANFDKWWDLQLIGGIQTFWSNFFMTKAHDYEAVQASDEASENELLILRMTREAYDKMSKEDKEQFKDGLLREYVTT